MIIVPFSCADFGSYIKRPPTKLQTYPMIPKGYSLLTRLRVESKSLLARSFSLTRSSPLGVPRSFTIRPKSCRRPMLSVLVKGVETFRKIFLRTTCGITFSILSRTLIQLKKRKKASLDSPTNPQQEFAHPTQFVLRSRFISSRYGSSTHAVVLDGLIFSRSSHARIAHG